MRFLICFLFCIVLLSFVDAGCYKEGRRPDAVKKKLSQKELYSAATATPAPEKSLKELPKNYDWCNVDGKSYCSVSWNQHIPQYCGACWIHGALGQANDRIKIQLNALHDNNLARQVILNCGQAHGYGEGCNGGEAYDIFEYMHRYGLPDETCQNYVAKESEKCDDAAICHNCMPIGEEIFPYKCWAVKPPIMYRVKEYGKVKGEAAMMSEILARGPITCGFVTTDDFDYNYRGGVYIDRSNSTDVNHDVEVVGWGEENGVKYWKARNSWGTYWGENGFFRILRGENNALFEDECVFAIFDTHEVEDVLDGTKKGSMYGIYSPDKLHKLPTPVQIEEYGKNDPRVYDAQKSSHSSHHQGQETTLIDAAKLGEAGVDALSSAVKGGEKIGSQATDQAKNAEKYIKSGEENAAKFAAEGKAMAKEFASQGKDYAKMAEKYASMQGNAAKGHGKNGKGGDNNQDYMKWAGSYAGDYAKYQKGYQQGGGQGGQGDSMKTGAKANVDEIKAAGKLSKQFIPNGSNYYKSPSTTSFSDNQQLSAAILTAFVEKNEDNDAEQAKAKETEEAIRHAIEEAFADEKADKKQTAEKIKSAIIAALNDIKVHVKEHGNNIKESASTAAKEEADEAKEVANDIANRVKSLGKEISDDIHQAAQQSKQNADTAQEKQEKQEQTQSLADSAAVADGVVSPSSSSSFSTVLGLCVTGVVLGGLYYGYQKKRENSYQML